MRSPSWFGMAPARPLRCRIVDPRSERLLAFFGRHEEVLVSVALGLAVTAAILCAAIYHVGRDNDLKIQLAAAQNQVAACDGIHDLATAIDQTPSGSRSDAGRVLARR